MSSNRDHHIAMQNRDLSWIQFNERVLDEAQPGRNPLLERANFLAIVTSNMDEFFQVRYHSAYEKRQKPSGKKRYDQINNALYEQCMRQHFLYSRLVRELYLAGVYVFPAFAWNDELRAKEEAIFTEQILPCLRAEEFGGFVEQKQLYLMVKLMKNKSQPYRLLPLPASLPRVYDLLGDSTHLIRLESIVERHLDRVFEHEIVEQCAAFRILRNQDFPVTEYSIEDVLPSVTGMLKRRETGEAMRIEAEAAMTPAMLAELMKLLKIAEPERVFSAAGPLDFSGYLHTLCDTVNRPDLKYEPAAPCIVPELMGEGIFEAIAQKDYLLYHPYHSFDPIVNLMEQAARDPAVTRICQTLYRVSKKSPVVAALIEAAKNGKEVFVLMEAHARFDEDRNLAWSEQLIAAGCKLCYGLPMLKVHSKITMIERTEDGETKRYLHLGTGNYNDKTAKIYTDMGLLTADPQLGADAALFFTQFGGDGFITMDQICQAPNQLQPKLLELIEAERCNALEGKPAHIFGKMNSIGDPVIIDKLIEAAQAGVKVELLVRGICCVLPKVKGLTDRIKVRSIVGRHLEHARVFVFENGGNHLVFLSSADWMVRNLYKRIELMFPIKDEKLRTAIENVLRLQWNDTDKCRRRKKDGTDRLKNKGGINAQEIMVKDIEGVFDGTNPVFEKIPALFAEKEKKSEEPSEEFNQAEFVENT